MRRPGILCLLVPLLCFALPAAGCRKKGNSREPELKEVAQAEPTPTPTPILMSFEAPGWSPHEVESLVAVPATAAILALPGVESVDSKSADGLATLSIAFARGRDPWADRAALLALPWTDLPDNVVPILAPATSPAPLLRYELASETLDRIALRAVQDTELRVAILSLPGVAHVATCGGAVAELVVTVDPQRSAAFGIDMGAVAAVLRDATRALPGLTPETARTIGEIVVAVRDDQPILLLDLATIEHGQRVPTCEAIRAGASVVEVQVWAALDVDRSVTAAAVRQALQTHVADLVDRGIAVSWPAAADVRVALSVPPAGILGSAFFETEKVARDAATMLSSVAGVHSIGIRIGAPDSYGLGGSPHRAELSIVADAAADVSALAQRISQALQLPGAETTVDALDETGQPTGLSWARVYGADWDTLREQASALANALTEVDGVGEVHVLGDELVPTLAISVEREAVAKLGITVMTVQEIVRAAIDGIALGHLGREGVDVRLQFGKSSEIGALHALPITTHAGMTVPLGQIVKMELRSEPMEIRAHNTRRYLDVRFHAGENAVGLPGAIEQTMSLAPGCELEWRLAASSSPLR